MMCQLQLISSGVQYPSLYLCFAFWYYRPRVSSPSFLVLQASCFVPLLFGVTGLVFRPPPFWCYRPRVSSPSFLVLQASCFVPLLFGVTGLVFRPPPFWCYRPRVSSPSFLVQALILVIYVRDQCYIQSYIRIQ